jgi:hypothetical protein
MFLRAADLVFHLPQTPSVSVSFEKLHGPLVRLGFL